MSGTLCYWPGSLFRVCKQGLLARHNTCLHLWFRCGKYCLISAFFGQRSIITRLLVRFNAKRCSPVFSFLSLVFVFFSFLFHLVHTFLFLLYLRSLCANLNKIIWHAGETHPGAALQDILRLLTLWFNHGSAPDVEAALQEGFGHVSIDTWLVVIPQVTPPDQSVCLQPRLRENTGDTPYVVSRPTT